MTATRVDEAQLGVPLGAEILTNLHPATPHHRDAGDLIRPSITHRFGQGTNFLGYIHISGHSRRGGFQLKRKSGGDRARAKLQVVKETLRRRMHETVDEQGAWLRLVVMGFNAHHAVPTNAAALGDFRHNVADLWRRTLRRRGQKGAMTWERMTVLANRWLPTPCSTHPWPDKRVAVKHPRWEPGAGIPPAGICAGACGDMRLYHD